MTTAMYVPRTRGGPDLRGNSRDRRARRQWLLTAWRADTDLHGQPACRCYRCGELLTVDTVTADRITAGCHGGRYTRNNIRPACAPCNSITGGALRSIDEGRPW